MDSAEPMTRSEISSQVVALAKLGVAPRDIARELNIAARSVYGRLRHARKQGEKIPRFSLAGITQQKRRVPLSPENRDRLTPHALARGKSAIDLAEELLARVVRDDLIDAVLDDSEETSDA